MDSLIKLYRYRELLWLWAWRSVKAHYQRTFLGVLWAILHPAALTTVYVVIFSFVIPIDSGDVPYPLFVYVGVLPWSFFSSSIQSGVTSIVKNMDLVTKIAFPREILCIEAVTIPLVDFGAGLLVLGMLFIGYHSPFSVYWGVVPALFLIQLAFTLSLIFYLSSLNVFIRDIGHLIPLLLLIWQFTTPIIYPLEQVPLSWQFIYLLNPMATFIESYKRILLYSQPPLWGHLFLATLMTLVLLGTGYAFFKRVERSFADVM